MLSDLKARLLNQYYLVDFTNNVKDYVLESAYSSEFGARPLKRFIQHNIETLVAKMIIDEEISPSRKYIVDYTKDTGFTVTKA